MGYVVHRRRIRKSLRFDHWGHNSAGKTSFVSTRLTLVLLCSLALAPAALAASNATGDGVLELKGVNATRASVTGQRGAIWGQIDRGTLKVIDLNPDDNLNAYVSGGTIVPDPDPTVTIYMGKNIHFRFIGGKYRFVITSASGLDVTAVGLGQAYLTGDPAALDTGQYAVDDGKWQDVPLLRKFVPFGTPQPVTTP
jgi:hypothetical protein